VTTLRAIRWHAQEWVSLDDLRRLLEDIPAGSVVDPNQFLHLLEEEEVAPVVAGSPPTSAGEG
jgi:hypothetical protein